MILTAGLSTYRPPLEAVRKQLQLAGGGRLVRLDDYRGESLYLAAGFAGAGGSGRRPTVREISYCRYRARSAERDYLVEIEKYAAALLHPVEGEGKSRFQAYWGGGVDLMRMKREGAVEQRDAPQTTQKDWLWGLCGIGGIGYFVSAHIALDARYVYDFVPASTFNGIEYSLGGRAFAYAFALYWKPWAP